MRESKLDRRHFLKQTAAGAGLAVAWPSVLAADATDLTRPTFPREAGTIVFQGDSITDAGRDKENQEANRNRSMGSGYVGLRAYPKTHLG